MGIYPTARYIRSQHIKLSALGYNIAKDKKTAQGLRKNLIRHSRSRKDNQQQKDFTSSCFQEKAWGKIDHCTALMCKICSPIYTLLLFRLADI